MTEFRRLTDLYYVTEQLSPADMTQAKADGFAAILCNRPDGEAEGQPTMAQMEEAATAAGLEFHAIPIGGQGISTEDLKEGALLMASGKKTLAYCRTGTRSTILNALVRVAGGESVDSVIAAAATAGYDLEPFRPRLEAALQ